MRIGRSIQLRRAAARCCARRRRRGSRARSGTGCRAPGPAARRPACRAPSPSFLNCSRPTSRTTRPGSPGAGREGELDRVRGRQRRVEVAAEQKGQASGRPPGPRPSARTAVSSGWPWPALTASSRQTTRPAVRLRALRIGRVLLVEDGALGDAARSWRGGRRAGSRRRGGRTRRRPARRASLPLSRRRPARLRRLGDRAAAVRRLARRRRADARPQRRSTPITSASTTPSTIARPCPRERTPAAAGCRRAGAAPARAPHPRRPPRARVARSASARGASEAAGRGRAGSRRRRGRSRLLPERLRRQCGLAPASAGSATPASYSASTRAIASSSARRSRSMSASAAAGRGSAAASSRAVRARS